MPEGVPVLDLNAFTAGVEPGGLTHGYEIKILVCYLLGQIGTGMTFTQISDALLHRRPGKLFRAGECTGAI